MRCYPLHLVLFSLLIPLICPHISLASADNPKPAKGDLVIPMPNNREMVFRPISVSSEKSLYNWTKFNIGDPSASYKETPTAMAVGGSFNTNGRWVFYVGKYEVDEAQWTAIMGGTAETTLPIQNITWFDAMKFIDGYNKWLYKNHPDAVPRLGKGSSYLRFPTEAEWEFAARGGADVRSAIFDAPIPYSGKLSEFEWYSGPESSHNKLKEIGLLQPNPAGLHDMLGNVSEMTMSLYQIEYYQGRTGGFVSKGGNYFTTGTAMKSSTRNEQPFYLIQRNNVVEDNKKKTLGFRVIISSLVFPDAEVSTKMEQEWEQYRSRSATKALPVSFSGAKTIEKSTQIVESAKSKINEIRSTQPSQEVEQSLKAIEVLLEDTQAVVAQTERESAKSWIRMANYFGVLVVKDTQRAIVYQNLLKMAESQQSTKIEAYRQQANAIEQNIKESLDGYFESLDRLTEISKIIHQEAFSAREKSLQSTLTDDKELRLNIDILKKIQTHLNVFEKSKKIDAETWKADLLEVQL